MRPFRLLLVLLVVHACSGGGESAVVLSETGFYTAEGVRTGQRSGVLRRGRRVRYLGGRRTVRHGRILRKMVRCRLPGVRDSVWIPFSEVLPGGLQEQRLWIGYSTNAYRVVGQSPSLFPNTAPLTNLFAEAGVGVIVLGQRDGWLKTHFRNRILWFPNSGFSHDRVVPKFTVALPGIGSVTVRTSDWFVPSFGDERRYGPDRLFRDGVAGWMSRGSGADGFLRLRFERPIAFRLTVVNGFAWSANSYKLYNRLRSCRIRCGGIERKLLFKDNFTGPQDLGLWRGRKLVIKFTGIHPGNGRNRLVLQRLRVQPVGLR